MNETVVSDCVDPVERAVPANSEPVAAVGSTAVTIITGFLGAGKSTLLHHVLASPHGLRIAVIQNELSAAAGLEASTMVGPNGERFEEWLELSNGCVCCAVRDDLVSAIEKLCELKGGFDYVLVETTGMADPGPVAESFWLDAELESPLRLDGIVRSQTTHTARSHLPHTHVLSSAKRQPAELGDASLPLSRHTHTMHTSPAYGRWPWSMPFISRASFRPSRHAGRWLWEVGGRR